MEGEYAAVRRRLVEPVVPEYLPRAHREEPESFLNLGLPVERSDQTLIPQWHERPICKLGLQILLRLDGPRDFVLALRHDPRDLVVGEAAGKEPLLRRRLVSPRRHRAGGRVLRARLLRSRLGQSHRRRRDLVLVVARRSRAGGPASGRRARGGAALGAAARVSDELREPFVRDPRLPMAQELLAFACGELFGNPVEVVIDLPCDGDRGRAERARLDRATGRCRAPGDGRLPLERRPRGDRRPRLPFRASLLDRVCELVCEQAAALERRGRVPAWAEDDVLSDGEGCCVDVARRRPRARVRVHADA